MNQNNVVSFPSRKNTSGGSYLEPNELEVVILLQGSILAEKVDFYSQSFSSLIKCKSSFQKKLNEADIDRILSCPNNRASNTIVESLAFMKLVAVLLKKDYSVYAGGEIKSDEIIIATANEFEIACGTAIWLFDEGSPTEERFLAGIMSRNFRQRITKSPNQAFLSHSTEAQRVLNEENILLTMRENFFLVAKTP